MVNHPNKVNIGDRVNIFFLSIMIEELFRQDSFINNDYFVTLVTDRVSFTSFFQ